MSSDQLSFEPGSTTESAHSSCTARRTNDKSHSSKQKRRASNTTTPSSSQTPKMAPASTSSSTSKTSSVDIIIFSNSICKRINPDNFYRGKSTKIIAKSGAKIPDIERLVHDYNGDTNATCIILQAWTNSTAHESVETCEKQAKDLIEATLNKFPHANIFISGVLPRFWHDRANRVSAQLNSIFRRKCQLSERVSYIEQPPSFMRNGILQEDLYWDEVHLNRHGLHILITNFQRSIMQLGAFPHGYGPQDIK